MIYVIMLCQCTAWPHVVVIIRSYATVLTCYYDTIRDIDFYFQVKGPTKRFSLISTNEKTAKASKIPGEALLHYGEHAELTIKTIAATIWL